MSCCSGGSRLRYLSLGLLLLVFPSCKKAPPNLPEAGVTTAETRRPGVPQAAELAVRGYLSHEDCREQVKYVLHPEVNGPIMLARYADMGVKTCAWPITTVEGSSSNNCDLAPVGGHCFVTVSFSDDKPLEADLVRTGDGFSVDMRSTVGYNPMTFAAFKAARPTGATILRAWAKLSSLYVHGFDEKTYFSLSLRENKKTDSLWAYLKRSDGTRVFDYLKDGNQHPLMVAVRQRENVDADTVEVVNVVDISWSENGAELVKK